MRNRFVLVLSVLVAAIGFVHFNHTASRADENKDLEKLPVRSSDLQKWTKADITALQQILSAAKPERKDLKRARVLAYVIGTDAQTLNWLTVHEQMDKVLEALAHENLTAARDVASNLTTVKASGKPIDLTKHFFDADVKDWDRDLVMQLFKTPRAGGLGIEARVKHWVAAGVGQRDFDTVAETTQRISVIGSVLGKTAPPPAALRRKAQWTRFAKELQEASSESIAAAGKKDARAATTAVTRIDAACTNCHEVFK